MAFPARAVQHPGTAVKRAVSNKWVEFLERVGYAARGVLYFEMVGRTPATVTAEVSAVKVMLPT